MAGKKGRVLSSEVIELDLSDEDIEQGFEQARGLWLGRFTPQMVISDLETYGVISHLAKRGYQNIEPKIECQGFESSLVITGEHASKRGPLLLVEVRARLTHSKVLSQLDDRAYSSLVFDWILFQDPCAEFDEDHPQLPGQSYPGLDLFRLGTDLMFQQVSQLDVELILNHPQHFHNAVFYSPRYRFVDPLSEGHFIALKRDLLPDYSLAQVSQALNQGEILDEAGHRVEWKQNVQAWPRERQIEFKLFGTDYQRRVEQASNQKFRFA